MPKTPFRLSFAYVFYGALVILMGYFLERTDTILLLSSFAVMVVLAYVIMRMSEEEEVDLPYYWSVLLRVLLLIAVPALSDDVYRFIWDGRLLLNLTDPYKQLPSYYVTQEIPGLTNELFQKLNSPEYFSVYPPFNQLFFFLSVLFSPNSELVSIIVLRIIILLFEMGNISLIRKLLKHYGLPQKYGLFYALNPLVILELTGNLHFEAILIFFLLKALWAYEQERFDRSALFFGLSVATKFLPLIFLPLLLRQIGWKKTLRYGVIVMVVLVVSFLPLINTAHVWGIGESLELYFQKFEFNASVYYLARWYGFETEGMNIIAKSGKWMMYATVGSILLYAFAGLKRKLPEQMVWVWALYVLFATTVHPWYAIPLLAVSVFTHKRFTYVWTLLIFFTYVNYQVDGYQEQLWLVVAEYSIVVLFAIYEAFGRSIQALFFKQA